METVKIEVVTVRLNFHVNISEQLTVRECMGPSFEDDYLRKEVSCSKTNLYSEKEEKFLHHHLQLPTRIPSLSIILIALSKLKVNILFLNFKMFFMVKFVYF